MIVDEKGQVVESTRSQKVIRCTRRYVTAQRCRVEETTIFQPGSTDPFVVEIVLEGGDA